MWASKLSNLFFLMVLYHFRNEETFKILEFSSDYNRLNVLFYLGKVRKYIE